MAATLHVLRLQRQLAGYLRIGHTGHRKLADLFAAGRFRYNRVVFDAGHVLEQYDLLSPLQGSGCEIVLDPNFAEMATVGRSESSTLRKLPWARPDGLWKVDGFGGSGNRDAAKMHDLARTIAEFAVSMKASAVLAPTHLIDNESSDWGGVDFQICEALRYQLDRCGGANIAIDFQIITNASSMKDAMFRTSLMSGIANAPVENVWLRISGFGATATGSGARQFIENIRHFHEMKKPLIADMAGGFSGLATLALGAVAGLSHGIAQKETFKASDWNRPSGGGGVGVRANLPELDRYLDEKQLSTLFAVKGGKSRFACNDTACCRSTDDMIENSQAHFITQRHRQIVDISAVPESKRSDHFLLRHLDPAIRSARHGASLDFGDEKMMKIVVDAKSRMVRLKDALADLMTEHPVYTSSQSPQFRGGVTGLSAVIGR